MEQANGQGNPNTRNEMGSGERVITHVRPGMKRELREIIKTLSDLGELPPVRNRVRMYPSPGTNSSGGDVSGHDNRGQRKRGSSSKKTRISKDNMVQDNVVNFQNLDVLEGTNGDVMEPDVRVAEAVILGTGSSDLGQETNRELRLENLLVNSVSVENLVKSPMEMIMNSSKRIELKKVPTRLKDLLETGLLEGLPVHYIHGSKGRQRPESALKGIIQGTGILCSCNDCKGEMVLTPNQFELHARSGNKRPPEYIYLDNGRSLRDVLNACKEVDLASMEMVVKAAIGCANGAAVLCHSCKAVIPEAGGRRSVLCDSCIGPMLSGPCSSQISYSAHLSPPAGSFASTSCTSVPEVSSSAQSARPKMKQQGRLTRKDLRKHKSVLDELSDGTELGYYMNGRRYLTGVKTNGKKGSGITCDCCNEVMSPSQFEAHAGFASRRKPYMNIYSDGVSLHKLSVELSKIRKPGVEEIDDLCSICEDGGRLLCCESCPRAYHLECVGLRGPPEEKWFCKYCRNAFEKEKFLDHDVNAIAAGLVPGVNIIEEIARRCSRIVGSVETEFGACAICRGHDFVRSGFDDMIMIFCDQCEREYHIGCLREHDIVDLKAVPEGDWFCSIRCSSINFALRKLIEQGEQKLPEALSDIIRKKSDAQGLHKNLSPNVSWRLFKGCEASEDNRVWLSGAVNIFHDQFDPIADSSTRHVDLIPHMVYGRNTRKNDYFNIYCAILAVDSIMVCAGIFRIFGDEIAELPLVATRTEHQGKGYFQALYFRIEGLLKSLNVKNLVLPSAEEAESLWTNRFGFVQLDLEKLNEYKKWFQMTIFEGTTVLHKSICQD